MLTRQERQVLVDGYLRMRGTDKDWLAQMLLAVVTKVDEIWLQEEKPDGKVRQ